MQTQYIEVFDTFLDYFETLGVTKRNLIIFEFLVYVSLLVSSYFTFNISNMILSCLFKGTYIQAFK